MNVLLLSRYGRLAPSSRLRSSQYLPYLRAHGVRVTVAPLLGDDYVRDLYAGRGPKLASVAMAYFRRLGSLVRSNHFDLVWIEYELFPWLPAWGETFLSRFGVPYVVDYDDAIYHRYDRHPSRLVQRLLGRKIDNVMCRAALVIAGNQYLADRARESGAHRVEILPTVVDLDRYPVRDKGKRHAVFTIGWIGSPATAGYLDLVSDALRETVKSGGARVVLVGSGPIALKGIASEVFPWSEAREATDISAFDAGIMPLPDTPWTRGKCGYKLIQYMACALPVVASPVGVNTGIVEHGATGFLARNRKEWVEALAALQRNPGLRARMGAAGRKRVEEQYCLEVTAKQLCSLLRSAER